MNIMSSCDDVYNFLVKDEENGEENKVENDG